MWGGGAENTNKRLFMCGGRPLMEGAAVALSACDDAAFERR